MEQRRKKVNSEILKEVERMLTVAKALVANSMQLKYSLIAQPRSLFKYVPPLPELAANRNQSEWTASSICPS